MHWYIFEVSHILGGEYVKQIRLHCKTIFIFIFVQLFFIFISNSNAVSYDWQSIGLDGNWLIGIVNSPSSRQILYAGSYGGKIFKSIDIENIGVLIISINTSRLVWNMLN